MGAFGGCCTTAIGHPPPSHPHPPPNRSEPNRAQVYDFSTLSCLCERWREYTHTHTIPLLNDTLSIVRYSLPCRVHACAMSPLTKPKRARARNKRPRLLFRRASISRPHNIYKLIKRAMQLIFTSASVLWHRRCRSPSPPPPPSGTGNVYDSARTMRGQCANTRTRGAPTSSSSSSLCSCRGKEEINLHECSRVHNVADNPSPPSPPHRNAPFHGTTNRPHRDKCMTRTHTHMLCATDMRSICVLRNSACVCIRNLMIIYYLFRCTAHR